MTLSARFWSKVDRSGGPEACWLCQDACQRTRGGYGVFSVRRGVQRRAHRIAFELSVGPIPDGLCVCHDCPGGDNTRCVNPAHLWLGTHAENVADRDAKGRTASGDRNGLRVHPERAARGPQNGHVTHPEKTRRGSAHGRAKLADADALQILQSAEPGLALAERFSVSPATISSIRKRRTWQHLTSDQPKEMSL